MEIEHDVQRNRERFFGIYDLEYNALCSVTFLLTSSSGRLITYLSGLDLGEHMFYSWRCIAKVTSFIPLKFHFTRDFWLALYNQEVYSRFKKEPMI